MNDISKSQQFSRLLESHKGILIKVARTYCQRSEERQDLIQEIRIQIWLSLTKYKPEFKMSTWLYRIAINTAISFYRKDKQRQLNAVKLDDEIQETDESSEVDKEHQLTLLENFIQELDEFDKALMLLYLEGKKYEEISNILGLTKSNVGTKIGRIKSDLKRKFSKLK
ncbi:MAG: RNA polymerase sigma factor [Cytophagales bacterium]|nr:RNA polymerase sigma factor [Cytophagales bacterium]